MTKETLEAASKILGVLLDELAVPPEVVERARRAADRILAEVERSGLAAVLARPAGPTISRIRWKAPAVSISTGLPSIPTTVSVIAWPPTNPIAGRARAPHQRDSR